MDEIENRLAKCFASVFPDLPADAIRNASVDSWPAWDSLAAVTLVAVVQEEFGLQVDLADLPGLMSFNALHNYIRQHSVA